LSASAKVPIGFLWNSGEDCVYSLDLSVTKVVDKQLNAVVLRILVVENNGLDLFDPTAL
jgi:hypothetical protein